MSWTDPAYEMEGESGGGGTVIGVPIDCYFEQGAYGIQMHLFIRRSHPELTPNAKPEVKWTYSISGAKERDNWSIVDNGMRIVHSGEKPVNASSDLGKLFASVKKHLPYVEGFDPRSAESWKALSTLGDAEYGWLEEPKRKEDPPGSGKWVVDNDKDPKRTLIVIGYDGSGGTTNPPLPEMFDLSVVPADMIPALIEAAKNAGEGKDRLLAALVNVPGAVQVQALIGACSDEKKAAGLREALVGSTF